MSVSSLKKLGIVIFIVIAMIATFVVIILVIRNNTTNQLTRDDGRVCSDRVLQEAAAAIDVYNTEELLRVSSKVKSTPGHEKDASCMLVLIQSTIQTSDAKKSQEYLTKLKVAYKPAQGFRPEVGRSAGLTLDQLTLQVADIQRRADQYNKANTNRREPGL